MMRAHYEIDEEKLSDIEVEVRLTATLNEWREACAWLNELEKNHTGSVGSHGRRMLRLMAATHREIEKRAMGGFTVELDDGTYGDTHIEHAEDKSNPDA